MARKSCDTDQATAAVVAINLRRIKSITNQLADYVALISLADVRLDADPGFAPRILQLVGPRTPPEGKTPWDRALIYSLYDTDADSREVELDMVRLLTRYAGLGCR